MSERHTAKMAARKEAGDAFVERVYEHPSRMGRDVETFANYARAYESEARNSTMSRVANKLLGVRTEDGKTEILHVTTGKAIDRALGKGLVDRAVAAVKTAEQVPRSDMKSGLMASSKTDAEGNRKTLVLTCNRTADRAQATHGDSRDRLAYKVVTETPEGERSETAYAVRLSGVVDRTGPDGKTSRVHGNSAEAENMQAEMDGFPALEFPPEPLF